MISIYVYLVFIGLSIVLCFVGFKKLDTALKYQAQLQEENIHLTNENKEIVDSISKLNSNKDKLINEYKKEAMNQLNLENNTLLQKNDELKREHDLLSAQVEYMQKIISIKDNN